jgi:hypothetical protein
MGSRGHKGTPRHENNWRTILENQGPTTLYTIADVSARTRISRSSIYREIRNRKRLNGEIELNQEGRLTVVYVGRSVRVREQDLIAFIDALAIA